MKNSLVLRHHFLLFFFAFKSIRVHGQPYCHEDECKNHTKHILSTMKSNCPYSFNFYNIHKILYIYRYYCCTTSAFIHGIRHSLISKYETVSEISKCPLDIRFHVILETIQQCDMQIKDGKGTCSLPVKTKVRKMCGKSMNVKETSSLHDK